MKQNDEAWLTIFDEYGIFDHDFDDSSFEISAAQIKEATRHFFKTGQREVRILCKQDTREARPTVFRERGLFILPVRNGKYVIVKGEGYMDIPSIHTRPQFHRSLLGFPLLTSQIGNSEMQHLDHAYATSIIRTFMDDPTLVLTIRGRKYTPEFRFRVNRHMITAKSVQTEVDAGYEGAEQVVLVEAKNAQATNIIIRQFYYPFRQWKSRLKEMGVDKPVFTVFFEKIDREFHLWQFRFETEDDYNSIQLVRSARYLVVE